MTHIFPEKREVIDMHHALIEEFGGMPGILNEGALDSALMRPRLGYYDDLTQEAAALMESLANNHAFVDGNKRVAFFATDVFLRMNGCFIDCDNEAAYEYFMGLFATHTFRFPELKAWLERHVKPLPERTQAA